VSWRIPRLTRFEQLTLKYKRAFEKESNIASAKYRKCCRKYSTSRLLNTHSNGGWRSPNAPTYRSGMARNLESFSVSDPSIIEAMQLPDWTESDRMAWPPPKTLVSVLFAEAMAPPPDARFGADWAAARAKDDARRAANEARWRKEEEARQAESRRAYEASLRR
jgi:hypothetical protein